MKGIDVLVVGFMIAAIITMTHFSLVTGISFGIVMFLINLADTKKPVGRD